MRRALLLLAVVAGAACDATPMRGAVRSQNPEVGVDLMTRFADCALYRVSTGARVLYVARCGPGSEASTHWSETCGKGCTRSVEVAAVE